MEFKFFTKTKVYHFFNLVSVRRIQLKPQLSTWLIMVEDMDMQQFTVAAYIDLKRPLILLITFAFLTSLSTRELEDALLPGSEII